MSSLENRIYGWHCSKQVTRPRSCDYNIKGLELEVSDCDVGYIVDEMIDENILTTPNNENIPKQHTIVVEEDGSVDFELILKACGNKKLLKAVELLEDNLAYECCNDHGTSCHIHLNRRHLAKRGISELDMLRIVEFMYPILYRVSGRDFNSVRWCRSWLSYYNYYSYSSKEERLDLYDLAKSVDTLDIYDIDEYEYHDDFGRYSALNTQNSGSLEIRVFSNYYNFNSNYIRLYLDLCDLMMDIAEDMHGKSYEENYDIIMKRIKRFFMRKKNKHFFEHHELNVFFVSKEERVRLQYENIKKRLEEKIKAHLYKKEHNIFDNNMQELMSLIRVVRDINNNISLEDLKFKLNYKTDALKVQEMINEFIDNKIAEL